MKTQTGKTNSPKFVESKGGKILSGVCALASVGMPCVLHNGKRPRQSVICCDGRFSATADVIRKTTANTGPAAELP